MLTLIAQQGQLVFYTHSLVGFEEAAPKNPTHFTYDSLGLNSEGGASGRERPGRKGHDDDILRSHDLGAYRCRPVEPLPLGLTSSGRWLTTIQTDPWATRT